MSIIYPFCWKIYSTIFLQRSRYFNRISFSINFDSVIKSLRDTMSYNTVTLILSHESLMLNCMFFKLGKFLLPFSLSSLHQQKGFPLAVRINSLPRLITFLFVNFLLLSIVSSINLRNGFIARNFFPLADLIVCQDNRRERERGGMIVKVDTGTGNIGSFKRMPKVDR